LERRGEHVRHRVFDFSLRSLVPLVVGLDAEVPVLRGDWGAGHRAGACLQTCARTNGAQGGSGMKRGSLLAAAAVVLAANALTLVHVWRNRSGPADSDITLTERELPESY